MAFDGSRSDRLEGTDNKPGGLIIRKKQAASGTGEDHVFRKPDIFKASPLARLAEQKRKEKQESLAATQSAKRPREESSSSRGDSGYRSGSSRDRRDHLRHYRPRYSERDEDSSRYSEGRSNGRSSRRGDESERSYRRGDESERGWSTYDSERRSKWMDTPTPRRHVKGEGTRAWLAILSAVTVM